MTQATLRGRVRTAGLRVIVFAAALAVGIGVLQPGVTFAAGGSFGASYVVGQLTGGAPDFTTNASGLTASKFGYPAGTALDTVHHRLFVIDDNNRRVLVFGLDSNNNPITSTYTAQYVLGQANFTSNTTGTTQSSLSNPYLGIAYDDVNDRLFVSDSGNSRVLAFNLSGGITNGMNASYVLGEPNFTTNLGGLDQSHLSFPEGLAYDETTGRLYVADEGNRRVMVFNVNPGTIANGMNAEHVLGQANFTTSVTATTQSGMIAPEAIAFNSTTHQLFVGDTNNYRVLVFDLSGATTDGMNASYVLGQPNFTSQNNVTTRSGMGRYQEQLGVDPVHNILYEADDSYNRILVFDLSGGITNGMDASMVIGQPDFTTSDYSCPSPTDAKTICDPEGSISVDAANNRIWFTDSSNMRILAFDFATLDSHSFAAATIGTSYSTSLASATSNAQGSLTYTVVSGSLPAGLSLAASTGVISGTPTATGNFSFSVQAVEDFGAAGSRTLDIRSYTIAVLAAATVAAPSTGLPVASTALPLAGIAVSGGIGGVLLFRSRKPRQVPEHRV